MSLASASAGSVQSKIQCLESDCRGAYAIIHCYLRCEKQHRCFNITLVMIFETFHTVTNDCNTLSRARN